MEELEVEEVAPCLEGGFVAGGEGVEVLAMGLDEEIHAEGADAVLAFGEVGGLAEIVDESGGDGLEDGGGGAEGEEAAGGLAGELVAGVVEESAAGEVEGGARAGAGTGEAVERSVGAKALAGEPGADGEGLDVAGGGEPGEAARDESLAEPELERRGGGGGRIGEGGEAAGDGERGVGGTTEKSVEIGAEEIGAERGLGGLAEEGKGGALEDAALDERLDTGGGAFLKHLHESGDAGGEIAGDGGGLGCGLVVDGEEADGGGEDEAEFLQCEPGEGRVEIAEGAVERVAGGEVEGLRDDGRWDVRRTEEGRELGLEEEQLGIRAEGVGGEPAGGGGSGRLGGVERERKEEGEEEAFHWAEDLREEARDSKTR